METVPDVRDHLARLRSELDRATLSAALSLLVIEGEGAITRQRALISLARLTERSTDDDIALLRQLEARQVVLARSLERLRRMTSRPPDALVSTAAPPA